MRRVFEDFCVYGAQLAKRLQPVPQIEWDFVPVGQKRVKLAVDDARKNYAIYQETFAKPREVAAWEDASFSGFANLKWDSSQIQLQPRTAGDAESMVRYVFESPRKINSIMAKIEGKTLGGTVEVRVSDLVGTVLASAPMTGDTAAVHFDANAYDQMSFVVTVVMKGHANEAGQVLAEFAGISVESELAD